MSTLSTTLPAIATTLSPAVAIHLCAALAALVIGPVALWTRRGHGQRVAGVAGQPRPRPRLHRAAGYAWVTLMVATALSALFIHGGHMPHLGGFSPIHLLVPVTLFVLVKAFVYLARGNVRGHRASMLGLYFGACVGAGVLTLLPGRFLGQLVWGQWLGWL